jgi:hypothetical protein
MQALARDRGLQPTSAILIDARQTTYLPTYAEAQKIVRLRTRLFRPRRARSWSPMPRITASRG